MSREPQDAKSGAACFFLARSPYQHGSAPTGPSANPHIVNRSLQNAEGAGIHAARVTCHLDAKAPARSHCPEGALNLATVHGAADSWEAHKRRHPLDTLHHQHHTNVRRGPCQQQQRQQQEPSQQQQQHDEPASPGGLEHHHQSCRLNVTCPQDEQQQQQQFARALDVCIVSPKTPDSTQLHSQLRRTQPPYQAQQHTPCTAPRAAPGYPLACSGGHHNFHRPHHHQQHHQQQHHQLQQQQKRQLDQDQHDQQQRQQKASRPLQFSLTCLPLTRRILSLLLVLLVQPISRSLVAASALTGTAFPFENCVQEQRNSPFFASLYSYRENRAMNTSTICLQVRLLPTCIPGKYRCCNTAINKLKVFPALNCRGSVASAIVNGNTVTSFYWEEHEGFDILKVTPLLKFMPTKEDADGAIMCLNLKMPCWTVKQFAYGGQVLEYSLYDKKADNYECCPCGAVNLPSSEPGFPSLPPTRRTPPSPPGLPMKPPPPAPKPPPPKRKQPPPPPPPSPPATTPPPLLPPAPSPPIRRRSSPPSPPAPPPPKPLKKRSPPPPPSSCDVTVTLSRAATANQGFVDSTCSLYGTLVLIPLNLPADTAATITTTCTISDPSYMVMTLTMQPADAATLLQLYGSDAEQRATALALLGLNDCDGNFAQIESSCAGDGTPVIIECESPPPPPPNLPSPPRPPPPKPKAAKSPPSSISSTPPARSPPPAPPPQAPPPRIFVYGDSAYLLFYASTTFAEAESTCVVLGGHLAAIGSEEENNSIVSSVIMDLPVHGTLNVWFGLYIRTDKTAAIPGYNTDGTQMSYMPDEFEYDRTRSAVRYYMLACDADVGSCGWRYSPGGATDTQPSYLCEFTTSQT